MIGGSARGGRTRQQAKADPLPYAAIGQAAEPGREAKLGREADVPIGRQANGQADCAVGGEGAASGPS